MDGKEKENRETLWSGTRCLAGIRSGPHEAFLANTLSTKRVPHTAETLRQGSTTLHGAVKNHLKEQSDITVTSD